MSNPQFKGSILPGPPLAGPVFDAENVRLQRWMRFNPLRALDPENLSLALDQFETGILRQAALLWDAMLKRDDTLSFVVPQLENSIAAKPWGVFPKRGAEPREAARHAAALQYFYDHVIATDAFDRNVRGDRHLLLKQMGTSHALRYAVHHFIWRREPGKMIEVPGAEPVPALTATMEAVPLWFFENTTGTLRFLPFGGFGIDGVPLNWDGEWMVTTGTGIMFAASICYVFKRLAFQDWTIFNERYAQQKVIGQTTAQKDSAAGQALAEIMSEFNSDQGIVIYEAQAGDKLPISLLGPNGTVSVDLFERFLDRQDRKMAVMFRGSDLRNMSRDGQTTGVSAQNQETEALEIAHCAAIASACRSFIDRAVIRYSFGEGVEPLAYFGLPETNEDNVVEVRNSAGFLTDRGALVEREAIAQRLGITLTTHEADALQPLDKSTAKTGAEPTFQTGNTNSIAGPVATDFRTRNNGGHFNRDEARGFHGRWVKMGDEHVPVHAWQREEKAHAAHLDWKKTATEEEIAQRQKRGERWQRAQKNAIDRTEKEFRRADPTQPNEHHESERTTGHPANAGGGRETENPAAHSGDGEGLGAERGGKAQTGLHDVAGVPGAGALGGPAKSREAAAGSWSRGLQAGFARLERAAARLKGKAWPHADFHLSARKAAQEHLMDAQRRGALPTIQRHPDPLYHYSTNSKEHHVETHPAVMDMEPGELQRHPEFHWVFKHTKEGGFGFTPFLNKNGKLETRPATASEYFGRMRRQDWLFRAGYELQGVHADHGGGFVSRQPIILRGTKIGAPDVEQYMEDRDFQMVRKGALRDPAYEGTFWFHKKSGYLAGDVHPDNLLRDKDGMVHALDFMVVPAWKGTRLHRVVTAHLRQFMTKGNRTKNARDFLPEDPLATKDDRTGNGGLLVRLRSFLTGLMSKGNQTKRAN